MAKHKTVTVNQLHKMMAKLIDEGNGRLQVCINKETFRDNRESDGVTILPVDGCRIECIYLADDDGGTKINKDGSEATRRMAVLYGERGTGFQGVLSVESVERYIRELKWSDDTPDIHKTLVSGNIRGFASYLRSLTD